MTSIEHVDQLLTLNGHEFVDVAYHVLLGREADPTGRRYYLDKLALGAAKATVLRQLAESKECRSRQLKLAGLEAFIGDQRRARHWFWGTLQRSFRMEKQANRVEFQLGTLVESVQKLQRETGDRFTRLDSCMSQGGGAPHDGTVRQSTGQAASSHAPAAPWADTLSQPASQIFARLTQARAARKGA